eukprot:TRINITY_DN27346_c0_g2_i5.p1 TRINITY_DN27346_c0_g2~~TRINITY_DN27346_c0_g2_i5.p1  ORF type:complete len:440 (+),score=30.34 TRINITY_DN27346_c0_g2_i5:141-1322(+)
MKNIDLSMILIFFVHVCLSNFFVKALQLSHTEKGVPLPPLGHTSRTNDGSARQLLWDGRKLSQSDYSLLAFDDYQEEMQQSPRSSSGSVQSGSVDVSKLFLQQPEKTVTPNINATLSQMFTGSKAYQGSSQSLQKLDEIYWTRAGMESIIDTDDRNIVSNTSVFPFRTIGIIESQCKKGLATCTGTLIGPAAIVTSGHCVYQDGAYCKDFKFTPGHLGLSQGRRISASQYYVPQQFKQYSTESWYDVGVVVLDEQIGLELGWMGIGYDCLISGGLDLFTAGYPFNKTTQSNSDMYKTNCNVQRIPSCPCLELPVGSCILKEGYMMRHTCDTKAGQSGSPLWMNIGSVPIQPQIRALHSSGFRCDEFQDILQCDKTNKATVIGPEMYDFILSQT